MNKKIYMILLAIFVGLVIVTPLLFPIRIYNLNIHKINSDNDTDVNVIDNGIRLIKKNEMVDKHYVIDFVIILQMDNATDLNYCFLEEYPSTSNLTRIINISTNIINTTYAIYISKNFDVYVAWFQLGVIVFYRETLTINLYYIFYE